ncbi:MAG: hypothetical protein JXB00_14335 [Bacteroidales bacterium]|nr:hypothetical protein [Bacteroidales bacterium]
MKDRFEKFIIENREAFDVLEPGDGVWANIEKNIRPKKTINWYKVMGRVAAVILIFSLSYMVHEVLDGKDQRLARGDARNKKELIIPEIREAEIYYSGLINEKLQEIKPMLSDNPILENEIRYDLNQLDSIYASLKQDLKENIASQEVIEAMIENYRLRLTILEDILTQLKPEENDDTEKNNSYDM